MTSPTTTLHPARRGPRPVTADDLWSIPRVGSPIPFQDGTGCVVAVTTYDLEKNEGRGRIWLVPVGGAEPRPLTAPELSSGEPALSPDGKRLAFIRKAPATGGGSASGAGGSSAATKPQLYLMPLEGGEARRLTELPLGAFDPRWLPDGSGIVFAAPLLKGHLTPEATAAEVERREKDLVKAHVTEDRFFRFWDTWLTTGEVPHLFVFDVATETLRDLTPDSTTWLDWMEPGGQYDISPDGKEVAYAGIYFNEKRSLIQTAIFTVPLSGGPMTCLTPDHPADDWRPRYSPDGKNLVYGMQHDPLFYADRMRIMVYNRAKRSHSELIENWDRSPSHWTFGPDGTLYLETEDEGRISLFARRGSGEPIRIVRGGTVTGASVAAGKVFFSLQSLSQPPELHICQADGQGLRQITRFTEPATAQFGVGEVREMQFEGARGGSIQMFVVLPPNYEAGKRCPLVQMVHGGPHAISGDSFHFRWNAQAFAAPGYVLAMVNFQGSTSFGQDFAKRILGGWGDLPYEDVMRGTDAMVASGLVDETRMAAAGGSYGGYMAAWLEGHTDRFKCIVNHAGVYDTLSQYASDVTQGRSQSFGGEPWDGIEAIDRYNPARFASGFTTPMLVIHGERDYRVPVTQGLECYSVLKAKGVEARLVYFPDENHWVLKPKNSLLWYREVLGWLERFLGS